MTHTGRNKVTTAISANLSPEEGRELLRALIEETPLAIYAKDVDHRFLLSNRQHATLTGRPTSEILGRTDLELFGEEAAELEAATRSVLERGEHSAQEFDLTLADGELHSFLETIFPLFDDQGAPIGLGGFAADITARRKLEVALSERARELEQALSDLRATQAELVQQQKMAALGNLVAGVAHEVSSPLGVAMTASTVFDETLTELESAFNERRLTRTSMTAAVERLRKATTLTVRNLERAAKLVQSFKQVAADRSQFVLRQALLADWLEEVVTSLSPVTRKQGLRIETRVDAPTPIQFAASELQQIVTNLVVNASVHAFGEGGDPGESIESEHPDRWIRVVLSTSDAGLEVEVADNGVGMTPEVAARVYDPFFTTRRGRGGTGLGLHITFTLVTETFGGRLSLETSPGQGARFVAALPWRDDTLRRTETDAP